MPFLFFSPLVSPAHSKLRSLSERTKAAFSRTAAILSSSAAILITSTNHCWVFRPPNAFSSLIDCTVSISRLDAQHLYQDEEAKYHFLANFSDISNLKRKISRECVSKLHQRPIFSSDFFVWTRNLPSCLINSWKSSVLLWSRHWGYATRSIGFPRNRAKEAATVASASMAKWIPSWLRLAFWSVYPASSCTEFSLRNWRCGSIPVKCRIVSGKTVRSASSTTNGKWRKRWGRRGIVATINKARRLRRLPTLRIHRHHRWVGRLTLRPRPWIWVVEIHRLDVENLFDQKWNLWWMPAISWPLSIWLPTFLVKLAGLFHYPHHPSADPSADNRPSENGILSHPSTSNPAEKNSFGPCCCS